MKTGKSVSGKKPLDLPGNLPTWKKWEKAEVRFQELLKTYSDTYMEKEFKIPIWDKSHGSYEFEEIEYDCDCYSEEWRGAALEIQWRLASEILSGICIFACVMNAYGFPLAVTKSFLKQNLPDAPKRRPENYLNLSYRAEKSSGECWFDIPASSEHLIGPWLILHRQAYQEDDYRVMISDITKTQEKRILKSLSDSVHSFGKTVVVDDYPCKKAVDFRICSNSVQGMAFVRAARSISIEGL